jgi:hypothetical protein
MMGLRFAVYILLGIAAACLLTGSAWLWSLRSPDLVAAQSISKEETDVSRH